MKPNQIAREALMEALENQLKGNNPPETRKTLQRLKAMGYSEEEAKNLIGQCLATEIFHVLKYKQPYNNERYIGYLKNLPKSPTE
jgi:hypothetical protein